MVCASLISSESEVTHERGPLQRWFQGTQAGRGSSYHNMVSEEHTSVSQPENPDTLDIVSDGSCEKIRLL